MKHLVLGSEGQIGKHLCKFLENKGDEIVKYDIKRHSYEDLRHTTAELVRMVKSVDRVHFLAFDVGGAKYLKKYQNTHDFISNNMKIMSNVFDLLKIHKTPFIFYSSQMSFDSSSSYGQLKFLGEQITKDLGGIIVRLWNVYGYEKEEEKAHVITDFIKMASQGEIKMMTVGIEQRQFLHADDCSNAIWMLSHSYEQHKGKDFDVSSFKWSTIVGVAKIIKNIIPCKIIAPNYSYVNMNPYTKYEPSYFKKIPGWEPKISLEEGIRLVYEEFITETKNNSINQNNIDARLD